MYTVVLVVVEDCELQRCDDSEWISNIADFEKLDDAARFADRAEKLLGTMDR